MKKTVMYAVVIVALVVLFPGCYMLQTEKDDSETKKIESIPFLNDQLYAVAYLGYNEIGELSFYIQEYLDSENIPIHYISKGEYYLVIPSSP